MICSTTAPPSPTLASQSLCCATQLVRLNLAGNKLTGLAAGTALASVLARAPRLSELMLERNMLTEEGTQALANGARSHPALALLRLDENFICELGAKALTKLLGKSPSLTSLSVCWNAIEKNQVSAASYD